MKQDGGFLRKGEHVTLVQSGTRSIWRNESTHQIQVRKVQSWSVYYGLVNSFYWVLCNLLF